MLLIAKLFEMAGGDPKVVNDPGVTVRLAGAPIQDISVDVIIDYQEQRAIQAQERRSEE